jgi:hypothetical protein
MYKLCPLNHITTKQDSVWKLNDEGQTVLGIPFAPGNTDYQRFKSDIANGVELQDANGTVMSSQAITEFLATLP